MRVGIGYDVHKLARGRKMFLGGVEIEDSEFGLEGHSDADALIHALMDAMFGAAGLRDIGYYFPNTDESLKGIRSTELLEKAKDIILKEGFKVNNIDTIVVAEYPRLSPFTGAIKEKLAGILRIDRNCVGVKATTEEGLGFTGSKEGVACHAIVSLIKA
ncbi:MAG TPA: 2-C-methyl-D-erythritol 2,4-cyclodiphosphate synthase [Firmicutes bacterium]|nr:2-C-methyl-D-erythritol 2,4-cyclodiphosphate synthase [Bacillota bacterium]